MIDSIYKNAFKEVYEILENTDTELIEKIPNKFIEFLNSNMNVNYQTNINKDIDIDKQKLLPETEAVLALIYRSYWITNEERQEISSKVQKELQEIEDNKKRKYKDISEIFKNSKSIEKVTINNDLMVVPKESFIKKLFKKLLRRFKK